jgi:sarcosine oxidase subunit alpha
MTTTGESTSQSAPPEPSGPASGATPESATIEFSFEGRQLTARTGQSIAAALFSSGIRTLSHSVKFHRPRGIFCGRGRCSMCAVEVDGAQGVKACTTRVRDGMQIRRQTVRPWFAPLLTLVARKAPLPAGFYYRFFTRPKFVRERFLASLRRMAGVGTIHVSSSQAARRDDSEVTPLPVECDVVVVGAGVSGMAAAVAAAQSGARVAVIEEYAHLGGHAIGRLRDAAIAAARDDLVSAVRATESITVVTEATVQALYDDRSLLVSCGAPVVQQRLHADVVVLATGALDTVPLFENNDLPGIFGTRGLRLFLERDGITLGKRAVVVGNGAPADDAIALLESHDIEVAAHVAEGTILSAKGGQRLGSVRVGDGASERRVACDMVCVAHPGQPDFALAQQAGFSFSLSGEDGDRAVMRPTLPQIKAEGQRVFLVGETAGITDWRQKIEHAAQVGGALGVG